MERKARPQVQLGKPSCSGTQWGFRMANCVHPLGPHLLSPAPHLPEHSGVRKRGPEEGHVISGGDRDLEGRAAVPVETPYQPETPNSPPCPAPC